MRSNQRDLRIDAFVTQAISGEPKSSLMMKNCRLSEGLL